MDYVTEDLPKDDKPIQSPVAETKGEPVAHLVLAPRFNIDTPDEQENGKLAEVWAYAAGVANSESIQDILWEVIHLESVLGAPRLGESRLDKLYRYTKLKRQEKQIQSELRNASGMHNL